MPDQNEYTRVKTDTIETPHGEKTAYTMELMLKANAADGLAIAAEISELKRRWGDRFRTRMLVMSSFVLEGEAKKVAGQPSGRTPA